MRPLHRRLTPALLLRVVAATALLGLFGSHMLLAHYSSSSSNTAASSSALPLSKRLEKRAAPDPLSNSRTTTKPEAEKERAEKSEKKTKTTTRRNTAVYAADDALLLPSGLQRKTGSEDTDKPGEDEGEEGHREEGEALLRQLAAAMPWMRPVEPREQPLGLHPSADGAALDGDGEGDDEGCVELWRAQSPHHKLSKTCQRRAELAAMRARRNATVAQRCERPLVAWDAPLAGGLTYGLASEAVSFLVPLSRTADVVLAGLFRPDSSFVASLDPAEREVLQKLRAVTLAHALPKPHIFVSQWAPGNLWLTKRNEYNPPPETYIISRAMYEATHFPSDWPPNFDKIDEFWVRGGGWEAQRRRRMIPGPRLIIRRRWFSFPCFQVPSEWNRRIFLEQYHLPPDKVRSC